MRYLIIHNGSAFYTEWFHPENYVKGMIVINRITSKITFDGLSWKPITEDHL